MKRLVQISLASLLLAAAGFAQSTNTWYEQWYKAKFGRYSPATEARLNAKQTETASRQEPTGAPVRGVAAAPSWIEQWHKAKYGRYSAAYEARQNSEQMQTTFRGEPRVAQRNAMPRVATGNTWREQWFKAKYGRYSPMEEARQRARAEATYWK